MMNNKVTVELPVASNSFETTAGKLGFSIATLLNLKRMIDLNMTDHSTNAEGMRGLQPLFSKQEMLETCEHVIDKLNAITYPYAI